MMKRPYIDMWDWISTFAFRAQAANDQARLRLIIIHGMAFELREKNPQQAFTLLKEGVSHAERLNEPWIAVSFECRMVEMLMLSLARYEEAVDLATRLVAKMSQEAFVNFPMKAWAFMNLIIAYFELDALSYADEILAMIETLETSMPIDADIHQRLYYYRACLWLDLRDFDKSTTDALIHMQMTTHNPFRSSYGYDLLINLSYLLKDDRRALEYAYLAQDQALKSEHQVALVNSYYWQALFLAQQDQPEAARRLFLRATAEAAALDLPQNMSFLRGRCRYHEFKGEYEISLAIWDEQIQRMDSQTPNRQSYFYVFLHRCFVLRHLGRLTQADTEQTRQAALRLRKPDKYLPLINVLHDGSVAIPRY